MWRIVEYLLAAAIILVFITEFFYPIIAGKPLFGSFRKQKQAPKQQSTGGLDDKISQAKEKVNEVKNVQKEVDAHFKTAEQLKDESDNLLNNQNK